MAPITLGIRREVAKNRPNNRPRNFYEYGSFQSRDVTLAIWGCNSEHVDSSYTLKISAYDIATDWRFEFPPQEVTLGENRSTELWSGQCPQPPLDQAYDKTAPSGTVVIHAILISDGQVIARYTDWPQPYKLLDLPNPNLQVNVNLADGEIKLNVDKPVKGIWISVEGDDEGLEFSDNSLDLFPGDEQIVKVKGIKGRVVTVASLWNPKAVRALVR
jgi:beta-mannosidase